MVQPPGDSRMFIIEQNGRIRILEGGKLKPDAFLDIRSKIKPLFQDFDERGLLAAGGLFVWWQLRDVAKARRQSIAKALDQAAEKTPD